MTELDNVRIGNGAGIFHFARQDERTSVMDGERNGATQTQQDTPQQETQQETQQQAQQSPQPGAGSNAAETDDAGAGAYEEQLAERDKRIADFDAQVADVAKTAEAAGALRGEIAELKAQGESERVDFRLQLAGVRSREGWLMKEDTERGRGPVSASPASSCFAVRDRTARSVLRP